MSDAETTRTGESAELEQLSREHNARERTAVASQAEQAAEDDRMFQGAVADQKSDAKPLFGGSGTTQAQPGDRLLQFLEYSQDPPELQVYTQSLYQAAKRISDGIKPGSERTVAIRHILDAREATIRALREA